MALKLAALIQNLMFTHKEPIGLYSPEKIESVELGMKGLFADNRLLLNLAYFDNEHKDMQTPYYC